MEHKIKKLLTKELELKRSVGKFLGISEKKPEFEDINISKLITEKVTERPEEELERAQAMLRRDKGGPRWMVNIAKSLVKERQHELNRQQKSRRKTAKKHKWATQQEQKLKKQKTIEDDPPKETFKARVKKTLARPINAAIAANARRKEAKVKKEKALEEAAEDRFGRLSAEAQGKLIDEKTAKRQKRYNDTEAEARQQGVKLETLDNSPETVRKAVLDGFKKEIKKEIKIEEKKTRKEQSAARRKEIKEKAFKEGNKALQGVVDAGKYIDEKTRAAGSAIASGARSAWGATKEGATSLRKKVYKTKKEKEEEKEKAKKANKIQALWRGIKGRKETDNLRDSAQGKGSIISDETIKSKMSADDLKTFDVDDAAF